MTHVTCRLTATNRDQLRKPMLGNRVWATFTLLACCDGLLSLILINHASQCVRVEMRRCPRVWQLRDVSIHTAASAAAAAASAGTPRGLACRTAAGGGQVDARRLLL